jgi:hypothetical protein
MNKNAPGKDPGAGAALAHPSAALRGEPGAHDCEAHADIKRSLYLATVANAGRGSRGVSDDMGGRVSSRGGQAITERRVAASDSSPITRRANPAARPSPVSDVLPVWCIGCGQQAATRKWYPYCSENCYGACADYELEKMTEAEKPRVKRRRAAVKQEYVGGIYTG